MNLKRLVYLPYLLLFGSLAFVGCAGRALHRVDTTPVSQSLSTIDKDFVQIQKEKSRKQIVKVAEAGRKEVATAQQKLAQVQADADKLVGERDWWKHDSEDKDRQIIEKNRVITKRDHKLNILGIALASACAFLAFNLLGMLLPYVNPMISGYTFIGRAALSGVVFLGVFAWVRYL